MRKNIRTKGKMTLTKKPSTQTEAIIAAVTIIEATEDAETTTTINKIATITSREIAAFAIFTDIRKLTVGRNRISVVIRTTGREEIPAEGDFSTIKRITGNNNKINK